MVMARAVHGPSPPARRILNPQLLGQVLSHLRRHLSGIGRNRPKNRTLVS